MPSEAYAWLLRRQALPAPLASASSVVSGLPLTPPVSQRTPRSGLVGPGWLGHWLSAVQDAPVMLQLPTSAVHCALLVQSVPSLLQVPFSGVQSPGTEHAAPLDWLLEHTLPMLQSLATLHDVVFGCPAVHFPGAPAQVVAWSVTVHDAPLFAPPLHVPVTRAHWPVGPFGAVHEAPTLPLVHDPGLAHAASAALLLLQTAPMKPVVHEPALVQATSLPLLLLQTAPTLPVVHAPVTLQATSLLLLLLQTAPTLPVVQAPDFLHVTSVALVVKHAVPTLPVEQAPGFRHAVAAVPVVHGWPFLAGSPEIHTPLTSAHCTPVAVQLAPTFPVVQDPGSVQVAAAVQAALRVAPALVHLPLSVQAAAVAHTLPRVAPALAQVFGLAWQSPTTRHGPLATPPVVL